jgi:hypothetical protein
METPPQKRKLGRDITLETHLNETKSEHNNHGYDDFKAEIGRQMQVNGRVNNSELARYMGVRAHSTIKLWRKLL